jgi:cytochrome c biogenesis protein
MLPVDLGDGVPVFLLGMRENPADQFRYLRVPADENGGDGRLRAPARRAGRPAAAREAVRRYAARPPTRPSRS